jgi:hypothetical protein
MKFALLLTEVRVLRQRLERMEAGATARGSQEQEAA